MKKETDMEKEKVISSFEDWPTVDELEAEYYKLSNGSLVPFCRLSGGEIQKINRDCEPPIPTSINPTWVSIPKDPLTNRPIAGSPVPDYEHPEYKKYIEGLRLDEKRIVMWIDIALRKASVKLGNPKLILPGNTFEEKFEILSKRLLNEVGLRGTGGLYEAIVKLSIVSSENIDFFSEKSAPLS